jgi:hypothetical protein
MKKQFLNILLASAFCLGSSSLVFSSHPDTNEEVISHVPTDADEQATKQERLAEQKRIEEEQARIAEERNAKIQKLTTAAHDAASQLVEGWKGAAKQVVVDLSQQVQDAAQNVAKGAQEQVQENLREQFGMESRAQVNQENLIRLAVKKSVDKVIAKCNEFINSIKSIFEMRTRLNDLINQSTNKNIEFKLDKQTDTFKQNYNLLPPDLKIKVAQAIQTKSIELINLKLKADTTKAREKCDTAIIALKTEFNKLSESDQAKQIEKVRNDIRAVENTYLRESIELRKGVPAQIETEINRIERALQPDQENEKTKGQILVSIKETLTQEEAEQGKSPKRTFEILDIKDIDLRKPLVKYEEVANKEGKKELTRVPAEQATFFKSWFGKVKMNALTAQDVIATYFADKAKPNQSLSDLKNLKTSIEYYQEKNPGTKNLNYTDKVEKSLNDLIPEFNNTKFSQFNYELQIDVVTKLIRRQEEQDEQNSWSIRNTFKGIKNLFSSASTPETNHPQAAAKQAAPAAKQAAPAAKQAAAAAKQVDPAAKQVATSSPYAPSTGTDAGRLGRLAQYFLSLRSALLKQN